MKAYYINLDRSPERRKNTENVLRSLGLNYERIQAFDGKFEDLELKVITNDKKDKDRKYLLACTLSHFKAIKTFNDSKYEVAIIFEDDICLDYQKYWNFSIESIIRGAPKDWEIIQLGVILGDWVNSYNPTNELYMKWYDTCYSAISYIINKKASSKLIKLIKDDKLDLSEQYLMSSDWVIYKNAITYIYNKPLFTYPNNNDSLIHSDHLSNHLRSKMKIEKYLQDTHQYKILLELYQQINQLRNSNKTEKEYNNLRLLFYFVFKELGTQFPYGNYKIKIDGGIRNLVFAIINELVILGYYMDMKLPSLKLSEKVIFDKEQSIDKRMMMINQLFYLNRLDIYKKIKLKLDLPENYQMLNPSILKTKNGYILNYRIVNYKLDDMGRYTIYHPLGKIITNNLIVITNKNFEIESKHLIQDENSIYESKITGLEDIILFEYQDVINFTCTTLDTNPECKPQITWGQLDDNHKVINKHSIISPHNRQEKNWLPFINSQGELNFIYEYHPYTIIKINDDNSTTSIISSKYVDLNLSRFKGSAPPISYTIDNNSGFLLLVHETTNNISGLRCYTHRFVWLDTNYNIKKLSHPWYFKGHGIEFCRSMIESHNLDELILGYSIHDKDAKFGIIKKEYVNTLLIDIEDFMF